MPMATSTAWLQTVRSFSTFHCGHPGSDAERALPGAGVRTSPIPLHHPADSRRAELMPAQLLGHLDLARRYALQIHLRQRRHQCFLAALMALEHFRPETFL